MKLCRNFRIDESGLGWRLPRAFWRSVARWCEEPALNPFGGHSPFGIRCDIDRSVKPHVICDALHLPFLAQRFSTVIFDPPYSLVNHSSRDRPLSSSLIEASHCLRIGGHILYVHTVCPQPPRGCRIIATHFLSATHHHTRIVCIIKKLRHHNIDFHNAIYQEKRGAGRMQAQLHDGRKKSKRQMSLDL